MFRCTSLCMIIIWLILIPAQAFAAVSKDSKITLLSIEDAIHLGVKMDAGVLDAKKNLSKKRTEWKQSLYAIINEAQKDAGPFARPHSLSKDLNIRLKLPEARKSLIEASENLVQQERLAVDKIRKLYISTYSMMNQVSDAVVTLQTAGNTIKEIRTLVKLGRSKQSDVEVAEEARRTAESELKQAKLNYKSALLDMGRATGLDMEQGYTFELRPEFADLKSDSIWKLIGHAEKNDILLSSAVMNRSIAEEKVNVTRQLYESKFGDADMKIIQSMFNKEMNEELFAANYEAFLERVEKQWDGFITILIPFPKSLFQGEFDGIRYFDDQRYSLPVSLFDLDKARKKEQETLELLLTGVKTSYLSVKSAEEAYSQALHTQQKVNHDYIKAKTRLRLKQITKNQYIEVEEKLNEAKKTVSNSYIAYYSAMYKLDLDTSGGLRSFIKQGILPWITIDDGLTPINSSPLAFKPLKGKFLVEPIVEPITSALTIEVDAAIGASHYQLFTKENIPLTPRTTVDQPLILLQMLLQSVQDYQVIFFHDQAPIAQASFEGIGNSGTLAIVKISSFEVNKSIEATPTHDLGTVIIGTFKVALSQLTQEIAAVALSTAADSGQGMYYQPANKVEQWIDLEKTLEYADIINNRTTNLDKSSIDALKLTISIGDGGALESLQTTVQLEGEISKLILAIEQLQLQGDEATDSGQLTLLAQIMQDIGVSMSKKAFLESLLLEDSGEAMRQLAAWSSSQSGEAPAPDGGNESEMIAEERKLRSEQLLLTLEAGNRDEVLSASILYKDAILAQLAEEQGIQQDIEALLGAKTKLEAAYDEAQQINDTERILVLLEALEAIQSDLSIAQKQKLFTEKQALDMVIAMLFEHDQKISELSKLRTEAIIAITEAEKLKYNEQELLLLNEEAERIVELYDDDIVPIPTQNLISGPYQIKLDLPPVYVDGHAMIQIRPISESFDALVVWNDQDRSVTITKNGIVVICKVGDLTAYVNGEPFLMEASPQLILGRTVVPLRFVAISLGIDVDWDSVTQTIELSGKGDIQQ